MTVAMPSVAATVAAHGLGLLASAQWSPAEDGEPPMLAGFVLSAFSPLVAAVADRCLTRAFGTSPAPPDPGDETAVVIVSKSGDLGTTVALAAAVDAGTRVPPLLFFQAVPNAVAGHIAARWGLRGPVVCVSPAGDALAEALAVVRLLVRDGDARAALVLLVEQSGPSNEAGSSAAAALLVHAGENAAALLVHAGENAAALLVHAGENAAGLLVHPGESRVPPQREGVGS